MITLTYIYWQHIVISRRERNSGSHIPYHLYFYVAPTLSGMNHIFPIKVLSLSRESQLKNVLCLERLCSPQSLSFGKRAKWLLGFRDGIWRANYPSRANLPVKYGQKFLATVNHQFFASLKPAEQVVYSLNCQIWRVFSVWNSNPARVNYTLGMFEWLQFFFKAGCIRA